MVEQEQESMIPESAFDGKFWNEVADMAKKQNCSDAKVWDYYVKLFKDGEFKEGQGASSNHTFADISLLMSILYAQDPNIEVQPRAEGDIPYFTQLVPMMFPDPATAQWEYATMLEKVASFIWTETKSSVHCNSALFEGLVRGMGVMKISFDPKRGCSMLDSIHRHEIFVDPDARYDITQARYIVQTCTMPIKAAREFFRSIGHPSPDTIEANYRVVDGEGLDSQLAQQNSPSTERNTHLKFFEMWNKDGDIRDVYYRKWDKDEWIFQCPWPYLMDKDEFPYEFLIFNSQFVQLNAAFGDLHTVNGLRSTYERVIEFYRSHVKRCLASKILYDKSAFGATGEGLSDLKDPTDMKFVGLEGVNGRRLDEVIKKLDFTEDAKDVMELALSIKNIKDQVFGIDDIQRGVAQRGVTATATQVQDSYGKLRIGRRQKILDEFLTGICRKRVQLDLQLMSPEKVARIVGPTGAMMWQLYAGDAEELKCQYSIGITAGSSGERAKIDKMERMGKIWDRMNAVNQTQMMPVYDTVKYSMELLKLDGMPHPESYMLAPLQPKLPMPGDPAMGLESQTGIGEPNATPGMAPPPDDPGTTPAGVEVGGPQPNEEY